ncbi:MAG: MBL fold hydrolase [Chloroflexi bacterium]|nr:MAG: MBL fold hydrolase [Chloroflexota bacterium]
MPGSQAIIVRRFVGGPLLTDCYALIAPGAEAMVIDAPRDAWRAAVRAAEEAGAQVVLVIATHGHWDHVTDLARVQELGIPVGAHPGDAYLLADPHGQGLDIPFLVDPVQIDEPLLEGDRLGLGDFEVRVLHTPGHTPGSITLYVPAIGALFTGDTLLKGGAGHTAEPGASLAALGASVRRLAAFPEATVLYPGHGAPTTIGDEAWLASLSDPDAPLVQWRPGTASKRKRN